MTNEEKAKNLDAWAEFYKHHSVRAAYFRQLAAEKRAQDVPPDTRPKCCEDGCEEKTLDGNRRCHAHYIDAVL